jgi:hypothetical protein
MGKCELRFGDYVLRAARVLAKKEEKKPRFFFGGIAEENVSAHGSHKRTNRPSFLEQQRVFHRCSPIGQDATLV